MATNSNKKEIEEYKQKKKILIYNRKNSLITKEQVNEIINVSHVKNFEINSLKTYQKAFIHKSYLINPENPVQNKEGCLELQEESNERLEFLGDSKIGSIVTAYLYSRYPTKLEGFLTKLKIKLVRSEKLAELARYLGLGKHIVMNKFMDSVQNGRENDSILENTFEAFIGALYEDYSSIHGIGKAYEMCSQFVISLIEQTTDFQQLITVDDNYKDQLLRYYQKTFDCNPEYHTLGIEGASNNRIFKMGVYCPLDPNKLVGIGESKKKKLAEQEASKKALEFYGAL